jgi:hypothetical protein
LSKIIKREFLKTVGAGTAAGVAAATAGVSYVKAQSPIE